MMSQLNQKRGQSTLEYAVLIIVIIAALIAIQTYIKRGVQGRLKSASDDIGDQFSPGNTNVLVAEKVHSHQRQTMGYAADGTNALAQGLSKTSLIDPEITNSVTKAVVINDLKENYGGGN